jgi:hypothetical protein
VGHADSPIQSGGVGGFETSSSFRKLGQQLSRINGREVAGEGRRFDVVRLDGIDDGLYLTRDCLACCRNFREMHPGRGV